MIFMLLNNKPKKQEPPKDDNQTQQENTDKAISETPAVKPGDDTASPTTTEKKPNGPKGPDKKDVKKISGHDNPTLWKVHHVHYAELIQISQLDPIPR